MKAGFTLIELLVVVLIIGILSAVALPQYNAAVERSRATEALTLMHAVAAAAQRFHAQHEGWPTNLNQIDVDIPTRTDGEHGGKHFIITIQNGNENIGTFQSRFRVVATRVGSHPYVLRTGVRSANDGTYNTIRVCAPVNDGDSDAQNSCNAIAGGANLAANGF